MTRKEVRGNENMSKLSATMYGQLKEKKKKDNNSK